MRPVRRSAALVAIVALMSACTAVAADRLPTSGADAQVETSGPSASASAALGAGQQANADATPTEPDADADADPAMASDLPATTPPLEQGTIVAHAVSPLVVARAAPSADADEVGDFVNPTDRGGPLVFQAVDDARDGWIEVLLPVRPNGTTGWVAVDDVELSRNPYRIEVDLGSYELVIERDGEVQLSAPVAVGQGGTPTPIGDFYLVELLQPADADGPYGTYAYGLSGYSDVLDSFNGGEGVIGIHGTNQPDLLGGPASHGCIRVHNDTIEAMAEILPLGTPVTIIAEA